MTAHPLGLFDQEIRQRKLGDLAKPAPDSIWVGFKNRYTFRIGLIQGSPVGDL